MRKIQYQKQNKITQYYQISNLQVISKFLTLEIHCNKNYTIQRHCIIARFSNLHFSSSRVADYIARYVSVISQDDYYNNAPNCFQSICLIK
jgi:hypothetical protein